MKIGIIGAMEPEVVHLINALENPKTQTIGGLDFVSGIYHNHELIITRSGIGKVAASIAMTLMIELFKPEKVINSGCAGGFDPALDIGDIVVSTEVRHHDADVTQFGYEIGQLPNCPAAFVADCDLVELTYKAIEQIGEVKPMKGLICSGDLFVSAPEHSAKILKDFPSIAACEMEGSAVAQVCHQFKVPFVVIRSISDKANNDSPVDFEEFVEKACELSCRTVLRLVKML
ncbi:MAG: 5'-methylthioadenosine/adenosylhomocysteine nucleosidase [Parashewanella sp.]